MLLILLLFVLYLLFITYLLFICVFNECFIVEINFCETIFFSSIFFTSVFPCLDASLSLERRSVCVGWGEVREVKGHCNSPNFLRTSPLLFTDDMRIVH